MFTRDTVHSHLQSEKKRLDMTGKMVLIVEDEAIVAIDLQGRLREFGYSVPQPVAIGGEAIEKASLLKPDLILMDIKLAGEIDGIEAAKRIRSRIDIPIIFLTAYTQDTLLEKAEETMPYGYLIKPVKDRDLISTIEVALSKHGYDKKLRESEEQFKVMFEMASIGMAQSDPYTGRWLRVNKRMTDITGYTSDEMLGMCVQEITYPEDRELDWEDFQSVIRGDRPDYRREKRYIRKDGSLIWVNENMTVIRDDTGQPTRTMATIEDISERKMAENAIKDSEEKFSRIFRNSSNAIAFTRYDDGMIFDVNDAWIKLMGYEREKTLGRSALDLGLWLDPSDRETCFALLRKEYGLAGVEITLNTSSGPRTFLMGAEVIELKGDKYVLWDFLDITERKKTLQALKVSEENLRSLFDNMTEGVALHELLVNDDGKPMDYRIIEVNSRYEKILGIEKEDIQGKRATEAYHTPEAPYLETYATVVQTGIPRQFETYYQPFDKYLEISAAPWGENGFAAIFTDITNRKNAEQALRETEEKFRLAFETSPDAININRLKDGLYIDVNEGFTSLTGFTKEDVVGKTSTEINIWNNPDERKELVQGLMSKGYYENLEAQFRRKDGSLTTALMSARIIMLQGTQHIISITRDISERKRAEDDLRRSEARFRNYFELPIIGIAMTSLEKEWIDVNDRLCSILGYTREDLMQKKWDEITHPDDLDADVKQFNRMMAGEIQGYSMEKRFIRKNGAPVWTSMSIRCVRLPGGEPDYFVSVIQDISDRKQAEEELFKLAAAVDQAAECVVITDPDGLIQYVNPAFERITGYTKDEVMGQNPSVLKSGVQDDTFYQALWETISRGDVWSGRFVNRRKNGTQYHEEASISPIRDKYGKIVNFVGVKKDITKEVELEAQLLQSQKMEAVGQLAGGVAHDLNNLLTPILGYSEILLEALHNNDPRYKDISMIQQAAESAKTLTRQLLAFSRKQVLEMKPVGLSQVLLDFKKIVKRTIREDIDIRIQPNASAVLVRADVGQIEQIIMNLSVNAQDAMPTGGVLTLTTEEVTLDEHYLKANTDVSPGCYVMLAISDTGSGMDSELMEHIFEPFFTTKGVGKGTGLGLSTVYGIVKQHSGVINVDSKPGKGTTFRIYLPRIEGEYEAHEEKPQRGKTLQEGDGTETILIVEDNSLVRDLASNILTNRGYIVISAGDGKECLKILADYDAPIDLLLTDVIMPDMNGKELYERLSQARPDLPVIYMSGYTEDALAQHGVLEKGVTLIHKPFTKNTLIEKVREILDRKSGL
jgi:two-component system, cell cycle sensor histidine kinase and response regulator CckA